MISLAARLSRHGLLFLIAKSTVLVAPLLAAAILSSTSYGTLEWWLSLSLAIGPLAGFGAHGVVAYGTVGSAAGRHTRTAVAFVLQICAVLVLIALVSPLLGLDWSTSPVGPVSLQCAVVTLQLSLAARLKGLGKGAWASLVESALYVSLLCALVLTFVGAGFVTSFMVLMLATSFALAVGLLRFVPLPVLARWPKRNYRGFYAAGFQFVSGGVLLGFFMSLPRASLGMFVDPDAVARFALTFRWLSVGIVAHQFINTVFFRGLFGDLSVGDRDRPLALTVALVGVLSILIGVFLFSGLFKFSNIPRPAESDYSITWMMAAAMVLWSASACLEGCLYRVGAAWVQSRAAAQALVASSIVVAIVMGSGVDPVYGLTAAWVFGFVVMIFAQLRALRGLEVRLPHLQSTAALLTISLLLVALFSGGFR